VQPESSWFPPVKIDFFVVEVVNFGEVEIDRYLRFIKEYTIYINNRYRQIIPLLLEWLIV
jgi:hypothetical protein